MLEGRNQYNIGVDFGVGARTKIGTYFGYVEAGMPLATARAGTPEKNKLVVIQRTASLILVPPFIVAAEHSELNAIDGPDRIELLLDDYGLSWTRTRRVRSRIWQSTGVSLCGCLTA